MIHDFYIIGPDPDPDDDEPNEIIYASIRIPDGAEAVDLLYAQLKIEELRGENTGKNERKKVSREQIKLAQFAFENASIAEDEKQPVISAFTEALKLIHQTKVNKVTVHAF